MSWLTNLVGGPGDTAEQRDAAAARLAAWETALDRGTLPGFVTDRLQAAARGTVPWLSTMSAAELHLARSHGIRPVGTVSGTCWLHYGYSWTRGHAEGWRTALHRMQQEALAAGANAVVDVTLRTVRLPMEASMDFTVVGTAVRMDSLPPSSDPAIATVPAMEFVRLLEAGIVPVGIAIGAEYQWLTPLSYNPTGTWSGMNQRLPELSDFWERVRHVALRELRQDGARLGNGVLAHTHFGELFKFEGGDKQPPRFLGRHIVIGTAVHTRHDPVPHDIRTVIDMRDDGSPLKGARAHGHTAYAETSDERGEI